jgi:hypothetical protein
MSFLTHYKLLTFTPSEGKSGPKSTSRSHKDVVDWKSLKKNRIYLFSIKQKGKTDQSRMEGKYLGEIRADSLTPSKKPPNSDGNTTEDNIDDKLAKIKVTRTALKARADSLTPSTKPQDSDSNTTNDNIDKLAKIKVKRTALMAEITNAKICYNQLFDAKPKDDRTVLRGTMPTLKKIIIDLIQQRKKLTEQRNKILKEQRSKLLFMESF